jgi:perosamine synthetase
MPRSGTELTTAPAIPLQVPQLAGNEWRYVKECLDGNWISSAGEFVTRFERAVADYLGAKHAVATINGTASLHVALLAAGIQPDDEVVVSTLTFIAPANAIRYVGAWPVFVDADPVYWQMDVERLTAFLDNGCAWRGDALYNRTTGRRVRAVLPVHILGHPVDMDPVLGLAARYRLTVIEDAAESLGAEYKQRHLGRMGTAGCLSFNGNKIVTAGGGGMIVTDSDHIAQQARNLTTQAKSDPVEYVHQTLGYNYRLTNVQAAIGLAQMEQLGGHIVAKRRIAAAYTAALRGIPGVTPLIEAPWAQNTFWSYPVRVDAGNYGMTSRQLLRWLEDRGIQTRPLWQPLHQSPAHAGSMTCGGDVAEALCREVLNLPCSVGLSNTDLERVVDGIRAGHASGRA